MWSGRHSPALDLASRCIAAWNVKRPSVETEAAGFKLASSAKRPSALNVSGGRKCASPANLGGSALAAPVAEPSRSINTHLFIALSNPPNSDGVIDVGGEYITAAFQPSVLHHVRPAARQVLRYSQCGCKESQGKIPHCSLPKAPKWAAILLSTAIGETRGHGSEISFAPKRR